MLEGINVVGISNNIAIFNPEYVLVRSPHLTLFALRGTPSMIAKIVEIEGIILGHCSRYLGLADLSCVKHIVSKKLDNFIVLQGVSNLGKLRDEVLVIIADYLRIPVERLGEVFEFETHDMHGAQFIPHISLMRTNRNIKPVLVDVSGIVIKTRDYQFTVSVLK